jgi:hypothetical protein
VGSGATAGAGTTRARTLELGAKTPWYRTEWILGGGTGTKLRTLGALGAGLEQEFAEEPGVHGRCR